MRYYLDPHGCAKNQVDAENMMAALNAAGWSQAADPSAAELCIVNTCGFIESAKKESLDAVFSLRAAYPSARILMAGCLAQRYATDLKNDLPEVDAFFGNADLSLVAQAAEEAVRGTHNVLVPPVDKSGRADFSSCTDGRPLLSLPGSAYIKITEGCDNCCTYCAIPLIRGNLRSRPIDSIVAEAHGLLSRGVKELCLIGQDLGSYGIDWGIADGNAKGEAKDDDCRLNDLLTALSGLEGDFWIRLLYIHPDRFPRTILETCARDPRILPYFDLPFQHASERILRAMNRSGDAQTYLKLIADIRAALPEATIRSTFLVGFPGETEEDFNALLDFQRKACIDWLGAFTYSREEGTVAYDMRGRVTK
ncbi:MAG: 30S ribosomal protein S12 methylthiotransferase RimO, partial [Treponemataceae bacterium]